MTSPSSERASLICCLPRVLKLTDGERDAALLHLRVADGHDAWGSGVDKCTAASGAAWAGVRETPAAARRSLLACRGGYRGGVCLELLAPPA